MNALSCLPNRLEPETTTPPINFFAASPRALAGAFTEYRAWLDQSNRIVHLSSSWDTHASPALPRRELLARPVSWFIENESVRECFRGLFNRVRHDHRTSRLVSRCDLPGMPRALQLTLAPLSVGAIELTWTYFDGAAARRIPITPQRKFQRGELLRVCSWCHDARIDSQWQHMAIAAPTLGLLDHVSLPQITHGICPSCSVSLLAETPVSGSMAVAV